MNPIRSSYLLDNAIGSYEDQLHNHGLEAIASALVKEKQQPKLSQEHLSYRMHQPQTQDNVFINQKIPKPKVSTDRGRRNFMSYIKSNSADSAIGSGDIAVDGLNDLPATDSKHSWLVVSNNNSPTAHKRKHTAYNYDIDTNSEKSTPVSSKRGTSPQADSFNSKTSSQSLNESLLTDCMSSSYKTTLKKSSAMQQLHEQHIKSHTNSINEQSTAHTDWIILLGLILGLLVSKVLQYLLIYLNWFQNQVLQLRNAFLGHSTLKDLVNFEDKSRHSMSTKLILVPMVGTCSLLYGLVSILRWVVHLSLTPAPNNLIALIEKSY